MNFSTRALSNRTTWTRFIPLITLFIFPSCNDANRQLERVAKDWCLNIRACQVLPVYPPTEDIQPGDVYISPQSVDDDLKTLNQQGFLRLDTRIDRIEVNTYRDIYSNAAMFSPPHDEAEPILGQFFDYIFPASLATAKAAPLGAPPPGLEFKIEPDSISLAGTPTSNSGIYHVSLLDTNKNIVFNLDLSVREKRTSAKGQPPFDEDRLQFAVTTHDDVKFTVNANASSIEGLPQGLTAKNGVVTGRTTEPGTFVLTAKKRTEATKTPDAPEKIETIQTAVLHISATYPRPLYEGFPPRTYPTDALPLVAFPAFSFEVDREGKFNIALPIHGIPTALSLMGSSKATGTISFKNACTYGIGLKEARSQMFNWARSNRDVLRLYAPDQRAHIGKHAFVRLISQVYLVKSFDVSLTSQDSFGGEAKLNTGPGDELYLQTKTDEVSHITYTSVGSRESAAPLANASTVKDSPTGAKGVADPKSGTLNQAAGEALIAQRAFRSVSLKTDLDRPVVIGYQAYDFEIVSGGWLREPLATEFSLRNVRAYSNPSAQQELLQRLLLASPTSSANIKNFIGNVMSVDELYSGENPDAVWRRGAFIKSLYDNKDKISESLQKDEERRIALENLIGIIKGDVLLAEELQVLGGQLTNEDNLRRERNAKKFGKDRITDAEKKAAQPAIGTK